MTIDDLRAAYPGLKLQEVSMDQFRVMTQDPMQMVQVVVAPAALDAASVTNQPSAETNLQGVVAAPSHDRPRPKLSGGDSWFLNFSDAGNIDSKGAAIVIFVVAGVIVVAAAVIYAGALIYNIVARDEDAPPLWWEPHARYLYFTSGSQHGWMSGGGVTMGFENEDAEVGVVLEGGYLDADVVTLDNHEVSVAGGYAMAGPTVRWYFGDVRHDYRLEMELLAGGASGYNMISRASIGLSWIATKTWRIGLGLGALYLDVKETEGPVLKSESDYNIFFGLNTGLSF